MNDEVDNEAANGQKGVETGTSILGVLLRIFLVLVVGCVIGAVIYFSSAGWVPYLTQRYSEPIESNQAKILEIAATQQALLVQLGQAQATLQEYQAVNQPDLQSTLVSAELAGEELVTAIETLQAYSYTQVPSLLATLAADQQSTERNLSVLATAQMAYRGNGFETELVQVLALLSHANQHLLHNNYGLAKDQLLAAQQILIKSEEPISSWQRDRVLELTNLIEAATINLPDSPDLAALQLELAWTLAIQGLSEQGIPGTPSPTGDINRTPTATP